MSPAAATYTHASAVRHHGGQQRVSLATGLAATPQGLVSNPVFADGLLVRPDVVATGVLAVADVAASRFADPGWAKELARLLDPVVTASGDRLRFESFSACNGVYARLDLLPDALEGDIGFGTTNVDVNPPLRAALAGMTRDGLVHLAVGEDELRLSTLEETHVERKVDLPQRWLKGFAEVPGLAHGARLVTTLPAARAARFLGGLPRSAAPGPVVRFAAARDGLRPTLRDDPGTVTLAGTARLRALSRVVPHLTALEVHAGPHGTSAWVASLPSARLTLVLSPGPFRAFSGEGSLLLALCDPSAERWGTSLAGALSWQPLLDPGALAAATGLAPDSVSGGLAWLAACGRTGYDLSEGRWFHRDLPVDPLAVLRRNPRLVSAGALAEGGAVRAEDAGWVVRSGDEVYRVRVAADGRRCECAWSADHEAGRGPCKHVLATVLVEPSPSAAHHHQRAHRGR